MKSLLLLFSFLVAFGFDVNATNYYTTSDGSWDAPLWSKISHTNESALQTLPCFMTGNDSIFIAHNIGAGACAQIELVSIAGNMNLVLRTGAILYLNNLELNGTQLTVIQNGAVLTVNGDLTMHGTSSIWVEGNFLVTGDATLYGNSSVCGPGTAGHFGELKLIGNADWCMTLPIELSDFYGVWTEKGVVINWVTESETNNEAFYVQRSYDGLNFENIGEQKGAGNSARRIYYEFLDENPQFNNEWTYYRIKQTDFDGGYSYSPIIALTPEVIGINEVNTFPNPASEYFSVRFISNVDNGFVTVINPIGQLVENKNFKQGQQVIRFNTQGWAVGYYLVIIGHDDYRIHRRICIGLGN